MTAVVPDSDSRHRYCPSPPIAGGWLLERALPLPIATVTNPWPGIFVFCAALLLAIVSVFQFFIAKTHVEPWQPTRRIIVTGVFRFSRNPIYLAFCVATIGCGLMLNSGWIPVTRGTPGLVTTGAGDPQGGGLPGSQIRAGLSRLLPTGSPAGFEVAVRCMRLRLRSMPASVVKAQTLTRRIAAKRFFFGDFHDNLWLSSGQ